MKQNVIQVKSFDFAIEIVKTYKFITETKKEFTLSKQLLRSGTSIGANVSESERAQSTKDFIHKFYISRKEANETLYWLKLMVQTDYISYEMFHFLAANCEELIKILTSIIKTTERKLGGK